MFHSLILLYCLSKGLFINGVTLLFEIFDTPSPFRHTKWPKIANFSYKKSSLSHLDKLHPTPKSVIYEQPLTHLGLVQMLSRYKRLRNGDNYTKHIFNKCYSFSWRCTMISRKNIKTRMMGLQATGLIFLSPTYTLW